MEENLKVRIPLEEYNELVSTHQRYHILVSALKNAFYAEGKYLYMKTGELMSIVRAVDPYIDLTAKRLLEKQEQKEQENNG